jgi:hypothetical protein
MLVCNVKCPYVPASEEVKHCCQGNRIGNCIISSAGIMLTTNTVYTQRIRVVRVELSTLDHTLQTVAQRSVLITPRMRWTCAGLCCAAEDLPLLTARGLLATVSAAVLPAVWLHAMR